MQLVVGILKEYQQHKGWGFAYYLKNVKGTKPIRFQRKRILVHKDEARQLVLVDNKPHFSEIPLEPNKFPAFEDELVEIVIDMYKNDHGMYAKAWYLAEEYIRLGGRLPDPRLFLVKQQCKSEPIKTVFKGEFQELLVQFPLLRNAKQDPLSPEFIQGGQKKMTWFFTKVGNRYFWKLCEDPRF